MKTDKYYLDPLIDAYKNSGWPSDERYFNIENGELIKNFSDNFFNTWKETVDNWNDVMQTDNLLIKDGKLSTNICSVQEIILNFKATKKVKDQKKNKDFYQNYLIENKDLYELMDMPGANGYMQILLPWTENDINNTKVVTINQNIHPHLYRVGDSLVTFYDFFEDIKKEWNVYYPDATKVIIRKNSLKRFYGITDINPEGGYYRNYDMSHNIFEDCSIRYFYLMPDGDLK